MPRIRDIPFIQKNFYHLELQEEDVVMEFIAMKAFNVEGIWIQIMLWPHGFHSDDAPKVYDRMLDFKVVFPRLPKDRRTILNDIGSLIGTILPDDMKKDNHEPYAAPFLKILGTRDMSLPQFIKLWDLFVDGK